MNFLREFFFLTVESGSKISEEESFLATSLIVVGIEAADKYSFSCEFVLAIEFFFSFTE
jgi:hypothetical protein